MEFFLGKWPIYLLSHIWTNEQKSLVLPVRAAFQPRNVFEQLLGRRCRCRTLGKCNLGQPWKPALSFPLNPPSHAGSLLFWPQAIRSQMVGIRLFSLLLPSQIHTPPLPARTVHSVLTPFKKSFTRVKVDTSPWVFFVHLWRDSILWAIPTPVGTTLTNKAAALTVTGPQWWQEREPNLAGIWRWLGMWFLVLS